MARDFQTHKICPKILLECVLSLSYNVDLRYAKIISIFSQLNFKKWSKQIQLMVLSFKFFSYI